MLRSKTDKLLAALRRGRRREQAAKQLLALGRAAVEPVGSLLREESADLRQLGCKLLGQLGDRRAAPALCKVLDDRSPAVAAAATEALAGLGDAAVETLVKVVGSTFLYSLAQQRAALKLLSQQGGPQAAQALCQALQKPDLRKQATDALREGDAHTLEPLTGALRSRLGEVRAAAAAVLGSRRETAATEVLIQALTDPHPSVRAAAAGALGQQGSPVAARPLCQALEDPQPAVRKAAGKALAELGRPAVKPLCERLRLPRADQHALVLETLIALGDVAVEGLTKLLEDPDWFLRAQAAEALADIGSRQATESLCLLTRDADADVRCAAVGALGRLGDPRAVPALRSALNESELRIRRAAAAALGRLASADCLAPLLKALEDPDLGDDASAALGDLGPLALEPLCDRLTDTRRAVRRRAAQALGALGDPRAIQPLRHALQDHDEVRFAAASALKACGWRSGRA